MKRRLLCLVLLSLSLSSIAQVDTALQRRLDEYLLLSKQLNFEKLMDYIHPSLFTLASKEQLVETFTSAFNNEELTMSVDSIATTAISPSFAYKGSEYKRIDYFIRFSLKFKDSSFLKDKSALPMIKEQIKTTLDAENVDYITPGNRLQIDGRKIMIAIKDNQKTEWMFLGYEPKQTQLNEMLIPNEVLKNFKL